MPFCVSGHIFIISILFQPFFLLITGSSDWDQVITIFLSTGMFVGGVIAFILDNLIPGRLSNPVHYPHLISGNTIS